MSKRGRFAIVITHVDNDDRPAPELPWLENDWGIDESDSVVLSADGWRAAAAGARSIWDALEQKLLVGFYVNPPELVAVVGHSSDEIGSDSTGSSPRDVRRIVGRIRSLLLPTTTVGFWTDRDGRLHGLVDPVDPNHVDDADIVVEEPEPAA